MTNRDKLTYELRSCEYIRHAKGSSAITIYVKSPTINTLITYVYKMD